MTETIGAYHDTDYPIPDGWQKTAELPGHYRGRYVWIEPDNPEVICAEPHNREICANPHSETDNGEA